MGGWESCRVVSDWQEKHLTTGRLEASELAGCQGEWYASTGSYNEQGSRAEQGQQYNPSTEGTWVLSEPCLDSEVLGKHTIWNRG